MLLLNAIPAAVACSPSDLQALRSFTRFAVTFSQSDDYYDDNALLFQDTWRGHHCCSWEGVTCSNNHNSQQRVSELALFNLEFAATALSSSTAHNYLLEPLCNLFLLSSLQLTYNASIISSSSSLPIPECLGNVSGLHTLSLSDTNLRGSIPSSFARLLHLQYLDLSFNPLLSGPLLPLAHLPTLTSLSLSSCSFSAPPPPFHTPLLESLDLSHNTFTSSTLLPFALQSQLPSLTHLFFSSCSLSGSLPVFNNSTPLLKRLDLSHNSFTSTLHDFTLYSHLPALTHLYLFDNSITGSIPSSIARLSSLVVLALQINKIQGILPESLCELTHLKHLKLSHNALVSEGMSLNRECRFIHLTQLDMSNNRFEGPFPSWIGRSPFLTDLDLSSNYFKGPLPNEWQELRSLETLDLSSNEQPFNSTAPPRLPEWAFRLPSLASLSLEEMGLQTEDLWCSDRLSMLNQTLRFIHLDGNNLTGPDTLQCFASHNFTDLHLALSRNPLFINLSDIQFGPQIFSLDLTSCGLEGHLPNRFVRSLEGTFEIKLSQNRLSGNFPAEVCNLQSPRFLNFSYNFFTGFDPCVNGTALGYKESIDLSHNALAGGLTSLLLNMGLPPANFCLQGENFWRDIDLSHNDLVGRIPSSLGLCGRHLNRIKLDNNRLSGRIPLQLGILKYLAILTLNNNYLSSSIPLSVVSIPTLILLDLSHNQLEGDLKTLFSFSNSTSLRVLLLSHNRISGSFPPFFGAATPSLQVIDLSYNNLTGTIPQDLHLPSFEILTEVVNINASETLFEEVPLEVKGVELEYSYIVNVLTSLDLSGNHLEGVIPPQLGNLSGLLFLNLSHNSLSGSIPAALADLAELEAMDLSFNELQGYIPSDLSSLTKLADFDVSFNEALIGTIPAGPQFERSQSYEGDPQLCGYPTLQACKALVTTETLTPGPNSGSSAAKWIDEWVSIPGLCIGYVVGLGGILLVLHGYPLYLRLHPRYGCMH